MSSWFARFAFFCAVGFFAYLFGSWAVDYGRGQFMDAEGALDALRDRDNRPAVFALQRLAETGDPAVEFGLGFAYLYGRGVEKDVSRGHELLVSAADRGSAAAAVTLGHYARRDHQGAGWDLRHSLRWYLRAAELGDPRGMLGAGVAYLQRAGTNDSKQAREWLGRAAEKGDIFAGFHLGEAYLGGRFGKADPVQAAKWYAQGGLAGDYDSLRYAISLLIDDTSESFDPETAYLLSIVGQNWWPRSTPNGAILFPATAQDALYTAGPSPDVFRRRQPPALALYYGGLYRVEHRLLSVPRLPPELRPALPNGADLVRRFDDATLQRIEAEANEIIASRPRPPMLDDSAWYDCICPIIRIGPDNRPHYWLWND